MARSTSSARQQRAEPFGLVIAEAMACGRAVITTAHGGAAELIEAGRDALVAPAGDARALAAAIDRLAADPMLRESVGSRAHAAAMTRFAPDRMAADLASVLKPGKSPDGLAQSDDTVTTMSNGRPRRQARAPMGISEFSSSADAIPAPGPAGVQQFRL